MNIGKMTKRVTLQKPTRVEDSETGVATKFIDVATVWAEEKKIRAGAIVNFVDSLNVEYGIRYRKDVSKGWRMVCDGRTFGVKATYPVRRDETVLVCEEVVP